MREELHGNAAASALRLTSGTRVAVAGATFLLIGSLGLIAAPATSASTLAPPNQAWLNYYNNPTNTATWASFCAAGGATTLVDADGVPACGVTGSTSVYVPGSPGPKYTPLAGPIVGFQCTELAERYLWVNFGFPGINSTDGAQVVSHYHLAHRSVPVVSNGTAGKPPHVGDVMSFSGGPDPSGHVAIVTAAPIDATGSGSVTFVGENQNFVSSTNHTLTAGKWTMLVGSKARLAPWTIKSFDKNPIIQWLDLTEMWRWVHQLGSVSGASAGGVAVDSARNSDLTGYTYSQLPGAPETFAGATDAFLAQYSITGERLWVHQLGSSGSDSGTGVAVDSSGDSYVVGQTDGRLPGAPEANAGGDDAFVAKYSPAGARLWVRQFGSASLDSPNRVAVDGAGNAYVTGYTGGRLPGESQTNAGGIDAFVTKYSPNGVRLWVQRLGSTGDDFGDGVAVDSAGNSYVDGYTSGQLPGAPETNAGTLDVFVTKVSSEGKQLWVHQLGSTGADYGKGIAVDRAGNSYITGFTYGQLPAPEMNAGSYDAFVAKYSPTGARLWIHLLGSPGGDVGADITADGAGNSFLTGYTDGRLPGSPTPNAGNRDVFTAKYSTTGARTAVNELGSSSEDDGFGIAIDGFETTVIAGVTLGRLPGAPETNSGVANAFIARYP